MSTSDDVRARVKREYDEDASRLVDIVANNTGKGIVSVIDNDELEGDVKIRHKACKKQIEEKFGKNANPHVEAIYARIFGLI